MLSSPRLLSTSTAGDSSSCYVMTCEMMNATSNERIRQRVADYYSGKIRQHGPTPAGVDWRDREGQEARFDGLLKIVDPPATSLIELGCGYGALYDYLVARGH